VHAAVCGVLLRVHMLLYVHMLLRIHMLLCMPFWHKPHKALPVESSMLLLLLLLLALQALGR
jgi:hypothetical protein